MSYMSDLQAMVGRDENILWQGKPSKKCFILESIFNALLPFALLWGAVDFFIISMIFQSNTAGFNETKMFIIPFMAIHLMPVWIYLGGVLLSFRRYRNTEYIVTDKAIYVSGGTFSKNYEVKPFTDLSHINIHRGIFDQWLGVGDVISVCHHTGYNAGYSTQHTSGHSHGTGINICDIEDYQRVFQMVKDLQTDIYADTMFPNDLRPKENHGYQTQYTGRPERWNKWTNGDKG